jgi:hypothetical protein
MCHCYGKITVELVPMRAAVTLPIRKNPLYQWKIRALAYQTMARRAGVAAAETE